MDKFYIKVGTKFCKEIEPDFKIVENCPYCLSRYTIFYKDKGENTFDFDSTEKLLKNPKVIHATGKLYRILAV